MICLHPTSQLDEVVDDSDPVGWLLRNECLFDVLCSHYEVILADHCSSALAIQDDATLFHLLEDAIVIRAAFIVDILR